MTKMKTVCKECGETIKVPKDFRKKDAQRDASLS
jgi:hypothetical protein